MLHGWRVCFLARPVYALPFARAAIVVVAHWRFGTGPSRASTWATCKTLFNQKWSWVARGLPLSVHWPPLIEGLLRLFRVTFGQVDSDVRNYPLFQAQGRIGGDLKWEKLHAWSSYRCEKMPEFFTLSGHGFFGYSKTTLASCDGILFNLMRTSKMVLTWHRPLRLGMKSLTKREK